MPYYVYRTEMTEMKSDCVGHVNDKGEIYKTPMGENPLDCVGHVNARGEVYRRRTDGFFAGPLTERREDAVGHVNAQGRVYRTRGSGTWDETAEDAVCHVNAQGRIYRAKVGGFFDVPGPETKENALGHVSGGCPLAFAGGAALLLLAGAASEGHGTVQSGDAQGKTGAQSDPKKAKRSWSLFDSGFGIFLVIMGILIVGNLFESISLPMLLLVAAVLGGGFALGRVLRKKLDQKKNAPRQTPPPHPEPQRQQTPPPPPRQEPQRQQTPPPPPPHPEPQRQQTPPRKTPQAQTHPAPERHEAGEPPKADTFAFFNCPHCSAKLRCPRGKGKIQITCPKCHGTFMVDDP